MDECPRDPQQDRRPEGRHRGHGPRQGEPAPGDLLGEGGQGDHQRHDQDGRKQIAEEADRSGAQRDGDDIDRDVGTQRDQQRQVPDRVRWTDRELSEELSQRAMALTPCKRDRDDGRREGERERKQRRLCA